MVTKCVKKLMLVITNLHILILFSVQANNLAATSLTLSSPPILPPYSSKLDTGELHLCLTHAVGQCAGIKSTWPSPDKVYELCIDSAFAMCFTSIRVLEDPLNYLILKNCIRVKCEPIVRIKDKHHQSNLFTHCLLRCFYQHVTNPKDVISRQNL
jgi:hypothetical protein